MKKTLLRMMAFFLALTAALTVWADNEIYYGIYQGTGTLSEYGTKKAETYDIALHLTDPTLVGMEIRGIRIPVNPNAANAKDFKVWLTKELTLESGKNVPDIVSMEVTPDGKWAEGRLAEPYTIGEGGVYAGYTFTVSLDSSLDPDPNRTPVMTVATENPEGLLIHTSRTYRKWVGLSDLGSPAILVLIGGEKVKENAASFTVPDNLYTTIGKSISTTLTLVNHGTAAIKKIDYEIELAGNTTSKSVSKSLAGGYYGRSTTLSVTVPAVAEAGSYTAKFRITQINGVKNEDPMAETEAIVVYLSEVPIHKPLVEEYTGTWCQYCPRALAGMEKMSDKNGDNFVGVAYHVQDEMEFTASTYLPANPSGLPSVFIDRVKDFAPISGQTEWENRGKIIAPANISVIGEWADEAKTIIKATSTTTFIRDFSNSPYRVGYILIANDVHSASWKQSNALSGSGTTGDAYLDKFTKAGNPIWDLHYNEVALDQSAQYGAGLAESLPKDQLGNTPYEHSYTFSIAGNTLPIDKNKLEVIAVLIDTTTGEVVNCNKGHVTEATGIEEVKNEELRMKNSQSIYDLSGRRASVPSASSVSSVLPKGVYINNGKKVVVK